MVTQAPCQGLLPTEAAATLLPLVSTEGLPGLDRQSLPEAWCEWLGRLFDGRRLLLGSWTFRDVVGRDGVVGAPGPVAVTHAGAAIVKRLARGVERAPAFVVREYGSLRGRVHLHSLSCDFWASYSAGQFWEGRYGFVKIQIVGLGESVPDAVRTYVTKYVVKSGELETLPQWWFGG